MNSKERNFLRKMAHNIDPMIRIGKEGLSKDLLLSIKHYIDKNEMIKIKLLQNTTLIINEELINNIETATNSIFVASIGKTIIFFKEKKENNKIGKLTQEFYNFKKINKKEK